MDVNVDQRFTFIGSFWIARGVAIGAKWNAPVTVDRLQVGN